VYALNGTINDLNKEIDTINGGDDIDPIDDEQDDEQDKDNLRADQIENDDFELIAEKYRSNLPLIGRFIGCYKDAADRVFKKLYKKDGRVVTVSASRCNEIASKARSGYHAIQNGTKNGRGECWYSPGEYEVEYDKYGKTGPCPTNPRRKKEAIGGGKMINAVYQTRLTRP